MINNTPRITSGEFRSRKLKLPKFDDLRIVRDLVRQAIFMIIGDKIKGARVMDLFAGSGVLGFESLSRGAAFVDFVDENYSCSQTILENANTLKVSEKIASHQIKAIGFVGNTYEKYDVVFLDPFYEDHKHKFLLQLTFDALKDDGIVVFLHGGTDIKDLIKSIPFEVYDERKYSKTIVTYLRKKQAEITQL
jgi:16S rRNA (guanine(966)-N(2))-methyltransferase RsmD